MAKRRRYLLTLFQRAGDHDVKWFHLRKVATPNAKPEENKKIGLVNPWIKVWLPSNHAIFFISGDK